LARDIELGARGKDVNIIAYVEPFIYAYWLIYIDWSFYRHSMVRPLIRMNRFDAYIE
jgi:hypothetical protein